jgi:hypothetical protein
MLVERNAGRCAEVGEVHDDARAGSTAVPRPGFNINLRVDLDLTAGRKIRRSDLAAPRIDAWDVIRRGLEIALERRLFG